MQAAQAARKSPAPGTEPGSRATDQSHLNYTPDLSEAERFLLLLDEDAEVFTFQTFDDDKDRRDPRLAIIRRGTLEQHADEFTRMQARGAGIFVAVQEMDGSGRNNAAVSRIRAVFVEDDGGGAGAMFPLEPSIIVESSPGKRHCYFLADGLTPGDFAGVQARLIQDFGSDPNAKDLARVLRLPGFWHLKDPANPHKVHILHESTSQPYSREVVLAAFPPLTKMAPGNTESSTEENGAIPEGRRNAVLASLAGTMRRRGMGETAILAALLAENEARCRPPLEESEVRAIAKSVGRYPPEPGTQGETGERGENPHQPGDSAGRTAGESGRNWGESPAFEPEPYPIDGLGPLAEPCKAIAEGGQIDPAMAGQSVLAVAALLNQAGANVRTLSGVKPLSLYLLTCALSGDGKTTAEDAALRPVREAQRRETARYKLDLERWKEGKGKEPSRDKPRAPYILSKDGTVEGIRRDFAEGLPSQGCFTSEAATMLCGYGMNADNRAKTAGTFNDLWDNGEVSSSRSLTGRVQLSDRRISLHWLIQPAAAAEALQDPLLANIGFWPRFLLAWPAPSAPRKAMPFHPEEDSRIRAFWNRCEAILAKDFPEDCRDLPTLEMTSEAHTFACKFFERMEREAKTRGGKLEAIRPFALRATEQLCRVAGNLAAWGEQSEIDAGTTRGAARLVAYSLENWLTAFGKREEAEAKADAELILDYLRKQPDGRASETALSRIGPKRTRPKGRRDAGLAVLEHYGVAEHVGGGYWRAKT